MDCKSGEWVVAAIFVFGVWVMPYLFAMGMHYINRRWPKQ